MTSTKVWRFEMDKEADKDFGRLDKPIKQRIIDFFERRVLPSNNPRLFGKALVGCLSGYWSYRVGRPPRHCRNPGSSIDNCCRFY